MKITWIGHSCFKVEKDDCSIVLDPYEDGSVPGLSSVREHANLVLCSHEHGDHNARDLVEIEQKADLPFRITKIESYHDASKGKKRGPNIIHIIEDGSSRIAHMGDIGCELEPDQIELLKNLDVLLVPVGGFFTINAKEAANLVSVLQPKVTVPMHYKDRKVGFGFGVLGGVDAFVKCMPGAVTLDDSRIESTDSFDAPVVVLQPENSKKK